MIFLLNLSLKEISNSSQIPLYKICLPGDKLYFRGVKFVILNPSSKFSIM